MHIINATSITILINNLGHIIFNVMNSEMLVAFLLKDYIKFACCPYSVYARLFCVCVSVSFSSNCLILCINIVHIPAHDERFYQVREW